LARFAQRDGALAICLPREGAAREPDAITRRLGLCAGRFTQHYTWQQIHAFLSVFGSPQNLQALYNIAPTTLIDIVRHNAEGPHPELVEEAAEGSSGNV
jgi:hypothetical protein